MKKERHVLIILPHPDDEAFGVAGTISAYVNNGTPITYACLTLGEMGRNMGNPPFANRETLAKFRKQELEEVAKILGIQDLRLMGLRDKTIEFEDEKKLVGMITNLIEEVNPSLIITFYPGYAVHPDHDACGTAVVKAIKKLPINKRPSLQCIAFSHNCEEDLGEADIVHDIRPFADKKFAAIKAHRTQTGLIVNQLTEKMVKEGLVVDARFQTERLWTYQWKDDQSK